MGSCYSGHRVARSETRPRICSTDSLEELEEIVDEPKPRPKDTKSSDKMKLKPCSDTPETLDSDIQLTKQQILVKQLYHQLQENKTQLPFELPDLWSLLGMESDMESGPSNAESQQGTPMTASADSIRDHVGKELRALRIHMAKSQAILTVLAKAASVGPPVMTDKFQPPSVIQSKRQAVSHQSSNDSNNPYLTDLCPFDVWEFSPEHSCRSSSQFSHVIGQRELLPLGKIPQTKTQSLDQGPSCMRTPVHGRKYRTFSCPILPSQATLVVRGTQTETNSRNSRADDIHSRSWTNQQAPKLHVPHSATSNEGSVSPSMLRHRSHSFLVAVRKGNPMLRDLPGESWSADSTASSADADEVESQTESVVGDRSTSSGQHSGLPRKLFSLPEEEQEDAHPEVIPRQPTFVPHRPRFPPPYRPPPPFTSATLSRSTPLLLSWAPDTSNIRCGPYSLEDLSRHYDQPPSHHHSPYADYYHESPSPCCNHRHGHPARSTSMPAPSVAEAPPNYSRRPCLVPAVVVQSSVPLRRPEVVQCGAIEKNPSTAVSRAAYEPIRSAPVIFQAQHIESEKSIDKTTSRNEEQQQAIPTTNQNSGGSETGSGHHFRRGSSRRRLGSPGSSNNPLIQRSAAVELDETDSTSKLPLSGAADTPARPLLTTRNRVSKPPRSTSSSGHPQLLDVETSETESAKNSGGSMESEPEHPVPPSPPVTATFRPPPTVPRGKSDTTLATSVAPEPLSSSPLTTTEKATSSPPQALDDVTVDDTPLADGPCPSLTDSFLGNLKLLRSKSSGQSPLTEKEIENKFHRLSLAVKTDKFTMTKRLELHRRQRDLAENNVEKDLKVVKEKIDIMTRSCGDHDIRFQLTQLQQLVNNVKQSAAKVSARAEVFGAVQLEDRLSQTVEIMLTYVENIKRQHDKLQSELDQARQFLRENQIASPRGPIVASSGTSPRSSPHPPMSRRRASVASIPRFLLKGLTAGSSEASDSALSMEAPPISKRRPSICCATHPFTNSPLTVATFKERNKESSALKINLSFLQGLPESENELSQLIKCPSEVPSTSGGHLDDLDDVARPSDGASSCQLVARRDGWPLLRDSLDVEWDDDEEEDDDILEDYRVRNEVPFTSPYHMDSGETEENLDELCLDKIGTTCYGELTVCKAKSFRWPKNDSPWLEFWLRWRDETDAVVQFRCAVGAALVFAAVCCLVSSFLPRSPATCSSSY